MRLSAYVAQHGVDAFNREDFLFVSHQVAKAQEPMILVGGQALETWGLFFDVLAPTGDRHPLTEDTDWLGSKRDAQWLCEQLCWRRWNIDQLCRLNFDQGLRLPPQEVSCG